MNDTKKKIKLKIAKLCDQIDSADRGTLAYKKALLRLKKLQTLLLNIKQSQ
jgi:hypothetical protein